MQTQNNAGTGLTVIAAKSEGGLIGVLLARRVLKANVCMDYDYNELYTGAASLKGNGPCLSPEGAG